MECRRLISGNRARSILATGMWGSRLEAACSLNAAVFWQPKNKSKIAVDNFAPVVHIHTMAKELDMSAAENCVCFNLRRVTRAVTQFFDAEMRRHGTRPTQGTILLALNAKGSWTMAELSDCLGLERTTLVRNLQPLQRDGLVTADGGGRGNRVDLAITAKGRKQIGRAHV